ncbi:MAG: glycosyltransferase [Hyphomicrobiales bacterium]|nr:MAG: glycosyltransferase [Hyphomicrobiales bacterium]
MAMVLDSEPTVAAGPDARLGPLEFETIEIAGMPIARLTSRETALLTIDLATTYRRGDRPWFSTSANGQVASMVASDPAFRALMNSADVINADGQPVRMAARFVAGATIRERVATTDLIHDVAELAATRPVSMFFLGASEEENAKAVANMQLRYPRLNVVGRLHGYHTEAEWPARLREINALRPDIVWLALGVPNEQRFFDRYKHLLPDVGLVKTSGGLFNFLSGSAKRAPQWMQAASLEWAYRVWQEPRRLFWRYFITNPHAIWVLLTTKSSGVTRRRLTLP